MIVLVMLFVDILTRQDRAILNLQRCKYVILIIIILMNNEDLRVLPYTATSLSVIGRFIFMYLLYKNKSKNSLSLTFCILSIFSSSMWIYYSINVNDIPMIVRSSTELSLLSISTFYIIRNKLTDQSHNEILPLSS